jgi:outer membrane protein assembly factor BamD (BamD/ComL family)
LRAGDARRALELIDAYRALPTGGELAAEASLLRIEALALSGQRDAAAREARQFASAYPNSPLIDRALGFAGGAK